MTGPRRAPPDRDATIAGGPRIDAPAGWLGLISGGALLIAFVTITMASVVVRPDPMLGLEIATAVPFVLVGVLSVLIGVVGVRSRRAVTAGSIAAVGLLVAGAILIAATREQQGFSTFRDVGIAPWIVDLLPWLIAGAAVAHLASAGAAWASTRLQRC